MNKDFYTNYAIYIHIISTFFTSYPSTNYDCVGGITIWFSTTILKTGLRDMMSNVIKDLSVFFLSPMSFKMEWHSSRFDKWYQNYGHEFELRECHCEGEIVGRTIIWLSTTTLKTGLHGVMLNAIKDLSVSSSSPIGFEVEWHSSRFDRLICWNSQEKKLWLISF